MSVPADHMSQKEQIARLRETGNGPTIADEDKLLREMFGEPDEDGFYRRPSDVESGRERDVRSRTLDMVSAMEAIIGLGEYPPGSDHNNVTDWYGMGNTYWCDMTITYAAWHSGCRDSVCFGDKFAYTVYHAKTFRGNGQWHNGVAGIRRGDVVFFDWNGSNNIGAIDHVGLVTNVRDGIVYTVEGNSARAKKDKTHWCLPHPRQASLIVGYGRPAYGASTLPYLHLGSTGSAVKGLQWTLNLKFGAGIAEDSSFGPATVAAVEHAQHMVGVPVDGSFGPASEAKVKAYMHPTPVLQRGSTGDAVRVLQCHLRVLGYDVVVDGSFGPAIQVKVRAFQRDKGLAQEGSVGPKTWAALCEGL